MHLKIIKRQMSKVPRSVGIPPLSDSSFEEALATQAAAATLAAATLAAANITSGGDNPDTGEDDGQMSNPLAGMGLSDDHYNAILQNLVSGDASMGCGIDGLGGLLIGGEKRALEDISDPRGQKKSRFEVLD
jgi:osomolarity two-component system response regulator SKN7